MLKAYFKSLLTDYLHDYLYNGYYPTWLNKDDCVCAQWYLFNTVMAWNKKGISRIMNVTKLC